MDDVVVFGVPPVVAAFTGWAVTAAGLELLLAHSPWARCFPPTPSLLLLWDAAAHNCILYERM